MDYHHNLAYQSFLLRLWRSTDREGHLVWRASLEDPATGERQGFSDLDILFEYIQKMTDKQEEDSK